MKKLMTVIAAVAMSFGLYAADVAASTAIPHFISFESADSCVDENGKLQKDGWAGDASVIDLVGGYVYSGADARRDDGFADKGVAGKNVKCLKLETGKEVVTCTLADSTKDIFFDQVVKFTGYEEAPTVTDGKIAVWMSAIEADDQAETPVPGETNLYITCASIALNGEVSTETINLGEYDIDAWHRVTIKSLGNIMADGNRAGFIVYIDGVQAKSIEGIVAENYLADFAKSYSNSGLLFPALVEGAVATVAYQGIGELDDVAIDDQGPQFARFVEGSVVAINGATLALTNLTDNTVVTVDPVTGKFQVAPGANLLFTYTAVDGNFLTGGKTIATRTGNIGTKQNYNFNEGEDKIESKLAVAKYMDDDSEDTFTASLQEALNADRNGEVYLLANETLTDTLVVPETFDGGALDLGGYTIYLAADKAIGIDIQADEVSISDASIYSVRTANVAGSKAINIPNKNVSLESIEINAKHYEYAIYANCDDDAKAAGATLQEQLAWFYSDDTRAQFATLSCDDVMISGNGSLFHIEGMTATLNDCDAQYDNNPLFANEAHRAAVYSSVNALTTITGEGSYEHENALQSGNLGGKIMVAGASTATFTGDIKSWMKVGAHDDLVQYKSYVATFLLLGGSYDGDIVFVDDTARELDYFQKATAVDIAAPTGFKWDETTGVLVKCDYVVTLSWNGGANKESFESAAEAFDYINEVLVPQGVLYFTANFTKDDESYTGYKFYADSEITIDGVSNPGFCIWDVLGSIDCTVGVENKKLVSVRGEGSVLTLAGLIKSGAEVKAPEIVVADGGIELSLASENGEAASKITTKTDLTGKFVNIPDGYKVTKTATILDHFVYQLEALETWNVTIGEYDTTQVASLTADPMQVREDAESKTVTLTATFQDGYALDYYTVDGEQISGNTFEIKADVEVGVVAKSTQQGWPEEGDPTIIDQTAAQAFAGKIPEELADVPAQRFTVWAKNKSGLDFATCKPADVNVDAYLLDCTPAEVESEKAKAVSAIEITSITFDGENWVITSGKYGEGDNYTTNAKVTFKEVTIEGADTENAKFWQATLVPDTTPAN